MSELDADCLSLQNSSTDSTKDQMDLMDEPLSREESDQFGSSRNKMLICHQCNERYKQPRILQCLHVFCTGCLEKLCSDIDDGNKAVLMGTREEKVLLMCPVCQQETKTWAIEKLPIDLIMMNMIDVADICEKRIICTSCKAQEKAVARCGDCASFLCPNCVTAHKFMRCFENHKVDSFEDLLNGEQIDIHKPFFCALHPMESVKYFCNNCQVPVCSECMLSSHKVPTHNCERICDVEERQIEDIRSIVSETRSKITSCDALSADLENMLSDLQQQRDYAQDLIKETCHSYKAVIEKCQDELLKELEKIHETNELSIMEMANNTEKISDRIEDSCKFTERILEHGNGVEVLSMKKIITQQLMTLLNNVPHLEPTVKIEFETDIDVFFRAVKATFGHFKKPELKKKVHGMRDSSLQSSFEGEQFGTGGVISPLLAAVASEYGLGGIGGASPDLVSSMTAAGITGLSSMHDTGIGALPGLRQLVSSASVIVPTSHHGGSSSFPERSLSRNSYSPAMSDSGISMDAASTGSLAGLSAQGFNLNALSKLGPPFALNAQGQITVNGQTIAGLNFNNSATSAPSLASRTLSMPPLNDTTSLAGLLNSVSLTPTTPLPTTSPPLGDLSSLLNTIPRTAQQLLGASAGIGAVRDDSPNHGDTASTSLPLNGVGSQSGFGFGEGQGSLRTRSCGKSNAMQIRCKFGQLGPGKGQFNSPHGFCLGVDEDIVVADTNNHRIQIFDKTGEFKYQFGIAGRDEGQLWYPRKVAVIRTSGKYVVCDRGSERSRMQLFTKTGQFIKKIGIRYIDIVAGLAISSQGHIVAVDSVSPTVFCINDTGDLVRWFDCSDYMREPSDIAISGKEYYVCDFKGHCVVVFNEEGQFMHRIGCENITNYPNGIDISDAGDILVGDSHGNRFHIAVFQRDGSLIGEFECPYVKVSRCCGLKITQEGYVVTLAKNNQHVLVLNTLYIA